MGLPVENYAQVGFSHAMGRDDYEDDFPLSFLVGSRGPFVPLKFKNLVIRSHGYKVGSIGSDGESSTLCE